MSWLATCVLRWQDGPKNRIEGKLHMSRRLFGFALVFCLALTASFNTAAAEKGNKKKKEARRERAVMGDSIAFALAHDDELKLTKEQKTFLQSLKKALDDEREKEPDEAKIRDLRDEMKKTRKTDKEESGDYRTRMRELMEKQATKWEERTNTELAKVLPKETMAKLKELRGDPDKLPENPFN